MPITMPKASDTKALMPRAHRVAGEAFRLQNYKRAPFNELLLDDNELLLNGNELLLDNNELLID